MFQFSALKKCRTGTDALLTEKHKERWSKEVEIMQRLNHRNVVKAIAVPPDLAVLRSKLPLMCMEFCSKGDLRQVRFKLKDGDDNKVKNVEGKVQCPEKKKVC